MSIRLSIPKEPSDEHRQAVLKLLADFNAESGHPVDASVLAVLLVDAAGAVVGGLWGKTTYQWLFVEFLVVPANLRGQGHGRALMGAAETIAIERQCLGSWLTTFTFQAQSFYEKLGYSVFGRLEDSPAGNDRIFMRKRLLQS